MSILFVNRVIKCNNTYFPTVSFDKNASAMWFTALMVYHRFHVDFCVAEVSPGRILTGTFLRQMFGVKSAMEHWTFLTWIKRLTAKVVLSKHFCSWMHVDLWTPRA